MYYNNKLKYIKNIETFNETTIANNVYIINKNVDLFNLIIDDEYIYDQDSNSILYKNNIVKLESTNIFILDNISLGNFTMKQSTLDKFVYTYKELNGTTYILYLSDIIFDVNIDSLVSLMKELTELYVSSSFFTDQFIQGLTSSITSNILKRIDFTQSNINNNTLKYIVDMIYLKPTISSVFLNNNMIDDIGLEYFCNKLIYSNITYLSLASNKITSYGVNYIGKLKKITTNTAPYDSILSYLSLNNNPIGNNNINLFVDFINLKSLTQLNLQSTNLGTPGFSKLCEISSGLINLENLDVSNNNITDITLTLNCNKLKYLYIKNNVINSGYNYLNKLTNLIHFDLTNNYIGSISELEIFNFINLFNINVINNIQTLTLATNFHRKTKYFIKLLYNLRNLSKLINLNLNFNYFNIHETAVLVDSIQQLMNLATLNLTYNQNSLNQGEIDKHIRILSPIILNKKIKISVNYENINPGVGTISITTSSRLTSLSYLNNWVYPQKTFTSPYTVIKEKIYGSTLTTLTGTNNLYILDVSDNIYLKFNNYIINLSNDKSIDRVKRILFDVILVKNLDLNLSNTYPNVLNDVIFTFNLRKLNISGIQFPPQDLLNFLNLFLDYYTYNPNPNSVIIPFPTIILTFQNAIKTITDISVLNTLINDIKLIISNTTTSNTTTSKTTTTSINRIGMILNGIGFTFKIINDKMMAIIGLTTDTDVFPSIPRTISYSFGTYDIVEIASEAFVNKSFNSNLFIPDNIIKIGSSAFYQCKFVGNLFLPLQLTEIGMNAFYGCNFTGDITIPKSLKIIGDSSVQNFPFLNCNFITNINYYSSHISQDNLNLLKNGFASFRQNNMPTFTDLSPIITTTTIPTTTTTTTIPTTTTTIQTTTTTIPTTTTTTTIPTTTTTTTTTIPTTTTMIPTTTTTIPTTTTMIPTTTTTIPTTTTTIPTTTTTTTIPTTTTTTTIPTTTTTTTIPTTTTTTTIPTTTTTTTIPTTTTTSRSKIIQTSLPNINNITSQIENNNVILNYFTTIMPDVYALESHIKNTLNVENVIVTFKTISGFTGTIYEITITIIPNTNINELSKTINDNIDKLLIVPGKKSNKIYIIIFILLLLCGLAFFYFKRQ